MNQKNYLSLYLMDCCKYHPELKALYAKPQSTEFYSLTPDEKVELSFLKDHEPRLFSKEEEIIQFLLRFVAIKDFETVDEPTVIIASLSSHFSNDPHAPNYVACKLPYKIDTTSFKPAVGKPTNEHCAQFKEFSDSHLQVFTCGYTPSSKSYSIFNQSDSYSQIFGFSSCMEHLIRDEMEEYIGFAIANYLESIPLERKIKISSILLKYDDIGLLKTAITGAISNLIEQVKKIPNIEKFPNLVEVHSIDINWQINGFPIFPNPPIIKREIFFDEEELEIKKAIEEIFNFKNLFKAVEEEKNRVKTLNYDWVRNNRKTPA